MFFLFFLFFRRGWKSHSGAHLCINSIRMKLKIEQTVGHILFSHFKFKWLRKRSQRPDICILHIYCSWLPFMPSINWLRFKQKVKYAGQDFDHFFQFQGQRSRSQIPAMCILHIYYSWLKVMPSTKQIMLKLNEEYDWQKLSFQSFKF